MKDNADLIVLTRGNGVDEGWINTEDGHWTPSLWDRRRLGVTAAQVIAENNGLPVVPPPLLIRAMQLNATEAAGDLEALMDNFYRWAKKNA